jgi:hypothetical protein
MRVFALTKANVDVPPSLDCATLGFLPRFVKPLCGSSLALVLDGTAAGIRANPGSSRRRGEVRWRSCRHCALAG